MEGEDDKELTGLLLLILAREIDDKDPRDSLGGKLLDDSGTKGGEKQPDCSVILVRLGTTESSNEGSTFKGRPTLPFDIAFAALRTA